jgi:protein-tyrosine phosphatase
MLENKVKNELRQRLTNAYGSHRGFFKTYLHKVMYFFGRYKKYQRIEWGSVERLVFVCKGNICRSAYGEAVARALKLETVSCGIDTVDGKSADIDAIRCATRRGYDLTGHKTTSINSLRIKRGDLLIAMEPSQAKFLENYINNAEMVTLAGIWSDPKSPYLQDPYGHNQEYFNACFKHIEKSVIGINEKFSKIK